MSTGRVFERVPSALRSARHGLYRYLRELALVAILAGPCLLLTGLTSDAHAQDNSFDQIEPNHDAMPGEREPQERVTDETHPITVVEKFTVPDSPAALIYPQALSSPRALMWSLFRSLDQYREILETEGRTYQNAAELEWVQNRIAYCFDLSDIDPLFQNSTATDAAVRLRALMTRVPLPVWASIPNAEEIEKMPEDARPTWYRFQDIPVELIKLDSGAREGKWVISKETRDRAKDAFARVKDVDPIAGDGDLIRLHFFEPGWAIPSSWIQGLPPWAGHQILDQSIWQWLVAIMSTLLVSSALLILFLVTHGKTKRPLTIRNRVAYLLIFLLTGIAMVYFEWFLQYHVFLHGIILEIFAFTMTAIMSAAFVCAILSLGILVAEIVIASPRINPRGLDAAMIRVAARSISILIAAFILLQIVSELGLSPTTLLAGAGVTGLAVALAAQGMLKNFLASVILLIERPCREGDYIRIGEDAGRVESIGLRSTCLRISKGNLVYIPNEEVAHGRIENISRRPHIRCDMTIGVTYSTPHEKLVRAVEIIREILEEKAHAPLGHEPHVFFSEFADSSLVIKCRYWQSTTVYKKSLEVSQDVNLAILERFNEEGLEFAFPTMTVEFDDEQVLATGKASDGEYA